MSDADRARVFDRFWRADPDRSRQQGHSGLGLSIVHQIVEAQNWRVAAFSQLGQGSTFVLWLPGPDFGDGPPNASPLSVTIGA